MADRFVLSQLKRLPLFARLSPEQLEQVAGVVQAQRFEPGEVVFRQGQPNPGLLLFVTGRGEFTQTGPDGMERPVGVVETGEYINESSLFIETTATFSLRIVQTSVVLFLARQQLGALLSQRPDIRKQIQPARGRFPGEASERLFRGQREGEKVLALFRVHWWSFGSRLWIPLLMAALLFGLAALAAPVPALSVLLMFLGVALPGAFSVYLYVEWRTDQVIISDQRVIHVQRTVRTVSTNISDTPLGAIQEVNVSIPSTDLFARVFNYGRVTIKTAGERPNLVLDFVPNPKAVQNIIFTNRNRYQEAVARQNRDAMRSELDKVLGRTPAAPADQPENQPIPSPAARHKVGFLQMKFINNAGEIVHRKHYLVWLGHVLLPSLTILGGIVLFVLSAFEMFDNEILGLAGFGIAAFVTLVGIGAFYLADWDWRNDLYIIGEQTVKLIHKRPLWLQDRYDQITLSQIDNVISDTSGVINTLFKMGTVKLLLTGAEIENAKVFSNVHRPQEIQQVITQRQRRLGQQKQEEEAQRQRQAILEYLSIYHDSLIKDDESAAAPAPAPPPVSQRPTPGPWHPNAPAPAQRPPQAPWPPNTPPPAQRPPTTPGARPPNIPRVRPDDTLR